jgi:hypothetical protein
VPDVRAIRQQGRRAPDAPAAASQHCRRRRLRGFDCPSSWPAVPQPDRRRRCCGRIGAADARHWAA